MFILILKNLISIYMEHLYVGLFSRVNKLSKYLLWLYENPNPKDFFTYA